MESGDLLLVCEVCKKSFVHDIKEQVWMREKFQDKYAPPRCCRECRRERKRMRALDAFAATLAKSTDKVQ